MQPRPQTSFIPKQTLSEGGGERRRRRKRGMSVFLLLSILIVLIAGAASAGIFLYGRFIDSSIERKRASLERAREAFDPALIEELARLDKRVGAAKAVLDQHIAPSVIFEELERSTLQRVRFNGLTYSLGAEDITLSMEGVAQGFAAVALQSDVFGESEVIANPVFSNLNLNERGNVTFSFEAQVNRDALRYRETLAGRGARDSGASGRAGASATSTATSSVPEGE